jgi:hypothetical protein
MLRSRWRQSCLSNVHAVTRFNGFEKSGMDLSMPLVQRELLVP